MKKIKMLFLILGCVMILGGCDNKLQNQQPDLTQIRAICELATLKTYFHNVAEFEKKAGVGITHLFETDRTMWIEYTGIAKIGIDMSKVNIELNNNHVKVTLPQAKVISIDIDNEKLDKNSYVYSNDNFINKNEISPEEETEAVRKAQEQMQKSAESNTQLMMSARERAKELIEKYIKNLGELSETEYQIEWEYLETN